YVFNFSGSRRYQMMREYYPAEYARLKQYIAQGKWFPCGSSVDENDANVPSAESYVRHILYGNRYFRHEFGVASEEYMLPDCFGFPAALPSVLVHCGLKGFSTQKLTWGLAIGQIPFKVGLWEGPDGRSLVAALDPGAYVGEVKENLATSEQWGTRIDNNGAKSGVYVDYHYFGTGDQGGAPKEPSVRMVEESVHTTGHTRVISGPADWMFKAITPEMQENLPKYKGELELTEHSAGSITSQAFMKRCNRKNELLADAAERAALGAWWLGAAAYPAQRIEDAWTLILGSQMHDILPGTSLPPAYEYAWNDEILAANVLADIERHSIGAICDSMDTRAEGTALALYNPLAGPREDVVEFTIPFAGDAHASLEAVGPAGDRSPVQVLAREGGTIRALLRAKMPGEGLAVYDIRESKAPAPESDIKTTDRTIDNARYTVKIDDAGDVSSIFDKALNKEMLTGPARLGLHYEKPANWPAWNQDWADRQKPARSFVSENPKITVVESGPVRGAIRVEREQEGSTFTQDIRLDSAAGGGGETVVFHTHIEWNTRERSLRAAFPLVAGNPKATYDIQTGVIERGNGHAKQFEYAAHQWVDLTDASGAFGVSMLNDCKYASDKPDDHTIRQTLLYTPGVRGNYVDQATQDIGMHDMNYAIYAHAGDWKTAGTPWCAARLNQPIRAFIVPKHDGALGKALTLLSCDNPNVMVTATKRAEDSDEIILRLRELSGNDAKGVKITLPGEITAAREVDGQERPIGPAKASGGALLADVHGFGLRAYAVKVAAPRHASEHSESIAVNLPYDLDAVSTNANRADGAMETGRAYPAEQLPAELTVDDVHYKLGPTGDGQANAVVCKGQEIGLPANVDRVEILAASSEGESPAEFQVGSATRTIDVAPWRGFVGQWDDRRWGGHPSETDDGSYRNMIGLDPGYVRPDSVAWFCSHHHTAKQDEQYKYCYLYRYALDVPAGAKSIRLPNTPGVKVFALTAVRNTHDHAVAAAPLRDMLADHTQDSQTITAEGAADDSKLVTIEPRLYSRPGAVHFTTDGADPTPASPVYHKPFWLSQTATIKTVAFDYSGKPGPITSKSIEVNDTTAPTLKRAGTVYESLNIVCEFSEPVDKSAGSSPSSYTLTGGSKITGVMLSDDGRTATLSLDAPLPSGKPASLRIAGITDRSPARNQMKEATVDLSVRGPVYHLEAADAGHQGSRIEGARNMPTRGNAPWTINMFVKMDKQPVNHTVIAGFGRCAQRASGTGRYLCKFGDGIHLWSHHNDLEGRTPFDLGVWQMITATYDGSTARLYKNGERIAEQAMSFADDEPTINVEPLDPWEQQYRFGGDLRDFTIWDTCLPQESLKSLRAAFKP
ncbi:MAG TPA: glycoside hydrolase family 38 C-terminal domain-containing protein, partial [Phycisphaerales bacterium]|nr:glycoside hydrolase family 38 C-terminal domain-containing protein [Phycisphaerales bacterium]